MALAGACLCTGSGCAMPRPTVRHQGGSAMHKLIVSSLALVLVTLGWGNRSLGEQGPAPRGELRIVDKHPANWAYITFNVFEHLVEVDKDGALVPRLATRWQWRKDRILGAS